ncbi:MAG: hypothetical protein WB809_06640 [Thermoplasmata archaeon]
MSGPPAPNDAVRRPRPGEFDLGAYLSQFLGTADTKFLLIAGLPGSGKSSLERFLVPLVAGPKLFVAFQMPSAPPGAEPEGASSSFPMLMVDPQLPPSEGTTTSPGSNASSLLAFSPSGMDDPTGPPPVLADAAARLDAVGHGTVFVDSWDRGTERYFRAQATSPDAVRSFAASPNAIAALQASIVSSTNHLVLALTPDSAARLQSVADVVVDLRDEPHSGTRLRVVSIPKVRGKPPPVAGLLYTLDGGRFQPYPGLPPGARIPVGPPDDDPDPQADSGWPGSVAFAHAFGRLRFGGATAITLSPDCPDTVPRVLTLPVALHLLRAGGRVVWIPSPSLRPAALLKKLQEFAPVDWLRERLRILSASGDDPNLGDLRSVVFPLVREPGGASEERPPASPGVRPLFPEIMRFLTTRREGSQAMLLVSLDGLRAALRTVGVPLDAATLPAVLGTYIRLPHFHAFGYGNADDPAAAQLRPVVDTLLHLEMVHGRPVVIGIRPSTSAHILDWSDADGRYQLVPVR